MKMFKSCLTTQEIFNQHKSTCPGLTYRRIPIPDFCAPKEQVPPVAPCPLAWAGGSTLLKSKLRPRQDFDRLLEAMKTTLAEDSRAAFVFNCASGRGRTTTAMVIAVLALWHCAVGTGAVAGGELGGLALQAPNSPTLPAPPQGVPEASEDEIVSVPDAKYTKGEFEVSPAAAVGSPVPASPGGNRASPGPGGEHGYGEVGLGAAGGGPFALSPLQVVMKVVQLLPDGHRMKKEVDMALDTVSETMTPMHYHLREIIICTYRQVGSTSRPLSIFGTPGRTARSCSRAGFVPRGMLGLLRRWLLGSSTGFPNAVGHPSTACALLALTTTDLGGLNGKQRVKVVFFPPFGVPHPRCWGGGGPAPRAPLSEPCPGAAAGRGQGRSVPIPFSSRPRCLRLWRGAAPMN